MLLTIEMRPTKEDRKGEKPAMKEEKLQINEEMTTEGPKVKEERHAQGFLLYQFI